MGCCKKMMTTKILMAMAMMTKMAGMMMLVMIVGVGDDQ